MIKTLILPPAIFIILLIIGLCCWKTRSLSFLIISFSTVVLYLLSLSPIALILAKYLQYYPALSDDAIVQSHAQAIVVLSNGYYKDAPEYGWDVANEDGLMRMQYAAYLYRKTHLPILVSGGDFAAKHPSEAQVMADVLQRDFNVSVQWIENQSEDTWQNAKYSTAILKAHGLQKAFVVTTAIHIPRSVLSFQHFGFDVIAAPTRFFLPKNPKMSWMDLIPNGEALHWSTICLYEYFGLVWYKTKIALKYW